MYLKRFSRYIDALRPMRFFPVDPFSNIAGDQRSVSKLCSHGVSDTDMADAGA